MNRKISRRAFGKMTIGGMLAIGAETLFACCPPIKIIPIRRNIANLAATDPIILTYKDAVTRMKALPSSDPRNWTRQAQIHDDFCPHGNWFFLPWHRAYLYYFEEICRELTGNDEFALPYWNWSADGHIPTAFWGGSSNPLFDGTRFATATSVAAPSVVGRANLETILNQSNFLLFGSQPSTTQRGIGGYGLLEGGPHNYVHGFVGGDMGTYMSPLDPVFWMHHNMIECCWIDWNLNRGHANTNDSNWLNFMFTGNFVQGDGSSVDVQVASTLLMPLFYRFEPCFPKEQNIADSLDEEQKTQALQAGVATNLNFIGTVQVKRAVEVRLGEPVSLTLDELPDGFNPALEANSPFHIVMTIGDVTLPATSDFYVRVFVNLPEANADTPTDDPHYAGSFAFFVDPEHIEHLEDVRPEYYVDITNTIRRLQAGGRLTEGTLDVQLVAVPVEEGREPTANSFTLEYLELGILDQPADQSK